MINTEFMLRYVVSYTMCASDTLEHLQQVNPQDSGFITSEGSTHTYKVSLVPAGKKQNVIGSCVFETSCTIEKNNLWTD